CRQRTFDKFALLTLTLTVVGYTASVWIARSIRWYKSLPTDQQATERTRVYSLVWLPIAAIVFGVVFGIGLGINFM
ncbi:MAG: hypothetical protein WCT54_05495, partial [Patescibacteria group bacterium]